MAITRYSALPWRVTIAEYETAPETGDSEPVDGPPASSPGEPALASSTSGAGHWERYRGQLNRSVRRLGHDEAQ